MSERSTSSHGVPVGCVEPMDFSQLSLISSDGDLEVGIGTVTQKGEHEGGAASVHVVPLPSPLPR